MTDDSLGPLPDALAGDGWRLSLRRLGSGREAEECARLMAANEPWRTLGRGYEASLQAVTRPDRETWVAVGDDGAVVGFVVLCLVGAFVGYLQSIAVREGWRSRGLGTRLVAFVESRVFRESPNVFLLVSSFNPRARALYERLGYAYIGTLRDYLVPGHDEHLLRKSLGPLGTFRPTAPPPA